MADRSQLAKPKSKPTRKEAAQRATRTSAKSRAKTANKTVATTASVADFVAKITPDARRRDAKALLAMMKRVTGLKPKMWRSSIIGFGSYHYKYASGREGDMLRIGFAPRKANFAIYIIPGFDAYASLLGKLGKFKTGRSCLYITRLADIDEAVLEELMAANFQHMKTKYPD